MSKHRVGTIEIGKAIKVQRVIAEMNQGELAQKSGVALSYISLLENDERNVPIKTLIAIADALEVMPSHLLRMAEQYGDARHVVEQDGS